MAMSALAKQSEDKIARQAYQRRKDEIFYYNKNVSERDEYKRRAEQAEIALAEKDTENEQLKQKLAELRAQIRKK
jgi:predicted adenine nucleotide alpha hydrolase (AANH) superfamily ATPase